MSELLSQHEKLIKESAIAPAVAAARGYRSITSKAELKRLGFSDRQCNVPALLIPIYNAQGKPILYQARPDEPRIVDGKPIKYETPKGARMALDIPPATASKIGDPSVPLFVTEGVRKADAACSHGLCCVALLGVWNWRGPNGQGGKTALADWEAIALNDRQVYLAFDSDVVQKKEVHTALVRLKTFLDSRGARVAIIYLPPGERGAKQGIDDFFASGKTVEDLLAHTREDLQAPPTADDEPSGPYQETNFGIVWLKSVHSNHETVQVPQLLTNFRARIISDVIEDDGAETRHFFEVEAKLRGRTSQFTIQSSSFASLNWVPEKMGPSAIVLPGFGLRDHARAAIQMLSGEVQERRIFTHGGWRKISNEWLFLHGGGAIGPNGPVDNVEVRLESALGAMVLPPPLKGAKLIESVRHVLNLRRIGKPEILDPPLCLTVTAPLSEIQPTTFSVDLSGPTGTFKTEIAALFQGFFGAGFNSGSLPGSWKSTGNSSERLLFIAKDCLTVLDDFAPSGSATDVARFHRDADNILRGVGNRSGRGRLRADGTARPTYIPRGAVLVTGEDVPRGHSLRARILVVEVSKGDIDVDALTKAQDLRDEGVFAAAMSTYIHWLSPRLDPLKSELREMRKDLRARLTEDTLHRRVPDISARLIAGIRIFLRFATDVGAVSAAEAQEIEHSIWVSLDRVAEKQNDIQKTEEVALRFLQLLLGAITSGRAYIADAGTDGIPEGAEWLGWRGHDSSKDGEFDRVFNPLGSKVGWVTAEDLFLEPEASFAVVQRLAQDQGTPLPINQRTLWRRMAEHGLLASSDQQRGKNVVRRSIAGTRRYIVHTRVGHLFASTSILSGPMGPPSNGPIGPDKKENKSPGVAVPREVLGDECIAREREPGDGSEEEVAEWSA